MSDWLLQLFDYGRSIRANCLITLSAYKFTEWLMKNKAANALIRFEEIVMVMIICVATLTLAYKKMLTTGKLPLSQSFFIFESTNSNFIDVGSRDCLYTLLIRGPDSFL